MPEINEALQEISKEIVLAANRVNRDPKSVQLVAVTKTVPVERISQAILAGVQFLGENRVQELLEKYPALPQAKWHLIGHLQSNKVKYIADKVSMIHSLDSLELAMEINKRAQQAGKVMDALVQVNISGEETKFGIEPSEVATFAEKAGLLPNLKIKGLMTIAPHTQNEDQIRMVFRRLKLLSEELKKMDFPGVDMVHLSMGMSNDYKIAVEEGATLIRLGSAIFGKRDNL